MKYTIQEILACSDLIREVEEIDESIENYKEEIERYNKHINKLLKKRYDIINDTTNLAYGLMEFESNE